MNTLKVVSVNISEGKGIPKTPVDSINLEAEFGIVGDAHAGTENRQVSLLAIEEIEKIRISHPSIKLGDFAENITTQGIELHLQPLGTRLFINDCILELTQIGKKCHSGCSIFQQVGDCIMPKKGVFAKVIQGGTIHHGCSGTYDF